MFQLTAFPRLLCCFLARLASGFKLGLLVGVGAWGLAPATYADPNPSASWEVNRQAELEEEAGGLIQLAQPTVTVRVVDAENQPVQGARIANAIRGGTDLRSPSWRFQGQVGLTDNDGRIVIPIDNLFARSSRSAESRIVFAWDMASEQAGLVHVHREDAGKEFRLALSATCLVQGEVHSATLERVGRSVRWAAITVEHAGEQLAEYVAETGSFAFYLPPGEYVIAARGPEFHRITRPLIIASDEEAKEVTIEVSTARLTSLFGGPAPELRDIRGWRNGSPVRLVDLRGNIVLLYFWRISDDRNDPHLSHLIKLHDSLGGRKGLVILGVHDASVDSLDELDRLIDKAKPYHLGRDIPFPIALDGGGEQPIEGSDEKAWGATTAAYGIRGHKIVLINAEGTLVGEYDQLTDEGEARLAAMLDALQSSAARLPSGEPVEPAAPASAPEDEPPADWRERFAAVYRLDQDEIVRLVAPPFIPERLIYYRQEVGFQARTIPAPPDYFHFLWDESLRQNGYGFVGGRVNIARAMSLLGLASHEYRLAPELAPLEFTGDWIVREGSSTEERLQALVEIIAKQSARAVRVGHEHVEKEVVVVHGRYSLRPLVGVALYSDDSLHLFSDALDTDEGAGGGTRRFDGFLEWLGDLLGHPVVNESDTPTDTSIQYANHRSSYLRKLPEGPDKQRKLRLLLANLERQTSLGCTVERRNLDVWVLEETTGDLATRPE